MSIVLLRNTTRTLALKHASRSLIVPTLPANSIKPGIRTFSTTLQFHKDWDDRRKAYKKKYDDEEKGGVRKDYKHKYDDRERWCGKDCKKKYDDERGGVEKAYKKRDDNEKGGVRKGESLANAEPVPWHYENVSTPPVDKQDKPSVKEKGSGFFHPLGISVLTIYLKESFYQRLHASSSFSYHSRISTMQSSMTGPSNHSHY
jgi:hypothetical protein